MAVQHRQVALSKVQLVLDQAEKKYSDESRDEAIAWLESREEEFNDDPNFKHTLGKYLLEVSHRIPDGIKKLEDNLKQYPEHLPTLLELGGFYLRPGNVLKASSYFYKAERIASKDPGVQISVGSLYQRKGDLPMAIEHYRRGLDLQLKNPILKNDPPPKDDFNIEDAENTMWDVLILMAKHGIHMFPVFGNLLGLERDGKLMEHDKDIDLGVPFSELERAIKILRQNGWFEINNSFGYINPRAFYNSENKFTIDVSGFVIDDETKKSITSGAWMAGIPKEWNMIWEFNEIKLKKIQVPGRKDKIWYLSDAPAWLSEIYGEDWQTPDKDFDSMVRAHNQKDFSLLAKCFAYSRIFEYWQKGNFRRARVLAQSVLQKDKNDRLIQRVIAQLSN